MSSVLKFSGPQGSSQRKQGDKTPLKSEARNAKVIAIASGKGGVGKTSLSTNLSIALSGQGHKVCLFDADTSLANVNILLNINPRYNLEHYVSGVRSIDEILVPVAGGIDIVPGASGITDLLDLTADQQTRLLDGLRALESEYDYLVIDTSAGVNEPLIKFLLAAPYVVVTITHEPTSLTDAFSLLKVLKSRGFDKPVHVIVNMAQNRHAAHETFKRFQGAVKKYLKLSVPYLGFVFSDSSVSKAVYNQHPFLLQYKSSLATRCVQAISQRFQQVIESGDNKVNDFSEFFEKLCAPEEAEATPVSQGQVAHQSEAEPEKKLERLNDYLEGLLSNCSEDESRQFLLNTIQAWVDQYQRFPESVRSALEAQVSKATVETTQVQLEHSSEGLGATDLDAEKSPKDQVKEHDHDHERAALIAASKIAALLASSKLK